MPQLTWNRSGVEEVRTYGNDHINIAGFNNLPPHLRLFVTRTARLRRHHESGASTLAQITPEVGNPKIVPIRHLLVFVHTRQTERQTWIGYHLFSVNLVYVKWRISHHEIALIEELVRILVKSVGLLDIPFERMHRQVHLRETKVARFILVSIERDFMRRVFTVLLNKVTRLDEHSARARCRIEDDSMVGLDDVHDRLHKRRWRKELTVVLRTLHGELHQEVFIDTTKHVPTRCAQSFAIKHSQHLFEKSVVKPG